MNDERDTQFDDELMTLAGKLPAGVSPERDLWPEIEAAVNAPARRQPSAWNSVWARAAAVVLLIGGSSGITYYVVKNDAGSYGAPIVTVDNVFDLETVSGDFGFQFTLGNEYLEARDVLESDLDQKLGSLEPEARDAVVKNLNTIRIAIKDINKALAEEPDNTLLQELLLSTYHEEMSLMKRVDGIANSAMRREDI